MVHLDFNLYYSQIDTNYGGTFGFPNWFFNTTLLTSSYTITNVEEWRTLNLLRNVTGLISFLFMFLYRNVQAPVFRRSQSTLAEKIVSP
jgi:hypothetical protein